MPSEAQINANRLNAQKSTGPTSPEGKARSALNALKTGIDAWSHIIPGEDPAELEALTEQFLLHYQPADPVQLSLVDTLISTEWIQRRLRRIEAQLWNYRVDILDQNLTRAEFVDPAIQRNSPLGHAFHAALDPLLAFIGFVPPSAPPPAEQPQVSHENPERTAPSAIRRTSGRVEIDPAHVSGTLRSPGRGVVHAAFFRAHRAPNIGLAGDPRRP